MNIKIPKINVWDLLVRSYRWDAKVKKVKLQVSRRQYELMKMKNDEKDVDYFKRLVKNDDLNGKCIKFSSINCD